MGTGGRSTRMRRRAYENPAPIKIVLTQYEHPKNNISICSYMINEINDINNIYITKYLKYNIITTN